jgi:hypothetical protein
VVFVDDDAGVPAAIYLGQESNTDPALDHLKVWRIGTRSEINLDNAAIRNCRSRRPEFVKNSFQ